MEFLHMIYKTISRPIIIILIYSLFPESFQNLLNLLPNPLLAPILVE